MKLKLGIWVLILSIQTFSCANLDDTDKSATAALSPPQAKVSDAAGTFLGYVDTITGTTIQIITSSSYVFRIYWDGTFVVDTLYYTSTDCSSTVYVAGSAATVNYGKFISSDGTNLYIPSSTNATGVAAGASVTYNSVKTSGGCAASSSTSTLVELKTVDKSTAGVATTITAPLSFSF